MVSYLVQGIALLEYFLSNRDTHKAQLPPELKEDTKGFFSFDPEYASKIYKKSPEELRAIVNEVGTDMLEKNHQLRERQETATYFNYFVLNAIVNSLYKLTCCAQEDFWADKEVKLLLKEEEITKLGLGVLEEFKLCADKIWNGAFLEVFPLGFRWFMAMIIDRIDLDREVDNFEDVEEHVNYLLSHVPDTTVNLRKLTEISKKFDSLFGKNYSLKSNVHRVAMNYLYSWLAELKKDKYQKGLVEIFQNEELPKIARIDPKYDYKLIESSMQSQNTL